MYVYLFITVWAETGDFRDSAHSSLTSVSGTSGASGTSGTSSGGLDHSGLSPHQLAYQPVSRSRPRDRKGTDDGNVSTNISFPEKN